MELPGNELCSGLIPNNIGGVWGHVDFNSLFKFDLPRLQFQLACIYILTQSFHKLFRLVHLPRIAAEIMVPSLLVLFHYYFYYCIIHFMQIQFQLY